MGSQTQRDRKDTSGYNGLDCKCRFPVSACVSTVRLCEHNTSHPRACTTWLCSQRSWLAHVVRWPNRLAERETLSVAHPGGERGFLHILCHAIWALVSEAALRLRTHLAAAPQTDICSLQPPGEKRKQQHANPAPLWLFTVPWKSIWTLKKFVTLCSITTPDFSELYVTD